MPGPWEKYAQAQPQMGPWMKYAVPAFDNSQPTQFERDRLSDVALVPVQRAVAKAAGGPAPDLKGLEPTVEGKLVPRGTTAAAMPVAAANNMLYPGTGTAAIGVSDIAQGNFARGTHKVLSGGFDAVSTLTPAMLANAPIQLGKTIAGGYTGSELGGGAAKLFGANEDQTALAGDVGGIVGGMGANLRVPASVKTASENPIVKIAAKEAAKKMIPGATSVANVYHVYKVLSTIGEALRSGKSIEEAIKTAPAEVATPAPAQITAPPEVTQPAKVSESINRVSEAATKGKVQPFIPAKVDVPQATIPQDLTPATATLQPATGLKPKIRVSAEAARGKKSFSEIRDDQVFQDAANADLVRHGQNADLEARREFAANNSMDVPKWQRVAESKAADVLEQAQKQVEQIMQEAQRAKETPVKYTKTPGLKPAANPVDNLTSLLEQSIAAAKAKKSAK